MGIYVPNMEMPKEGFVEVLIRDDGTLQQTGQSYRIDGTDYYTPYVGETPVIYKAIHVPPHGNLIDRDALMDSDENMWDGMWGYSGMEIMNAPTIIPAEEGET